MKEKPKSENSNNIENEFKLVVENDSYNTFESVIMSLIEICDHDALQAEQCAMLVHYKGKTTVRSGDFFEIEEMKNQLVDRGINAVME